MAITFDPSSNTIQIVAYTEASPCTFTDIYDADKAGTLSLHARTGITGTDADPVAVDRAERPADYVVLGGASNDLYITIANWVGTTATIRITGTDRDGTSQTEDIVVTANGDYYTTKWFKTITQTQVTAFTATSFDYDLTQGQWGVVSNQCTHQFCFDCKLQIGDGSTITWLKDKLCKVAFKGDYAAGDNVILVKTNAYFISGVVITESKKNTVDGCGFYLEPCINYTWFLRGELDSHIELYSTKISMKQTTYNGYIRTLGYFKCWNGIMDRIRGFYGTADPQSFEMFNTTLMSFEYGFAGVGGTFDKVVCFGNSGSWVINPQSFNLDLTYKNFTVYDAVLSQAVFRLSSGYNHDVYCINFDIPDGWTFFWQTAGSKVYRQYEFDLKVVDKDNTPINGATVKIWDKDGTLVVDTTTTGGVIATQTISRGYYNQANGDTLQDHSPHLIKIEKAGYTTYEADYTLEEKTGWIIALQTGGGLLRNPPMTGGMV